MRGPGITLDFKQAAELLLMFGGEPGAITLIESLLGNFWSMLRECESRADSDKDAVLRHQVEGYYRQWNHLTGQDHAPAWVRRASIAGKEQRHGA